MSDRAFPIVGVGSSAGGLEAMRGLFGPMASDTGLAFVIITHMGRGHESALADILRRFTQLPVLTAEHGQKVEPNNIYVCPPDHLILVEDDTLQIPQRDSDSQRKPIDVFLSSLSKERGEDAVGILLSGGGSDGTLGLKAIKERGGFTMAQGSDGTAPQHASMPDTAIAAGVVDLVVPIEHMAERLEEFARGALTLHAVEDEGAPSPQEADSFGEIHRLLLKQVGHDFSGYKQKTFHRRVQRRMHVVQIKSLEEYVELLRQNPEEVNALFRDLLIGVTNFFRDPGAFEALEKTIIPAIFKDKGANDTIRIWVPGCATGEEVYSIAILVREHLDGLSTMPKVQIFASDIDDHALTIARQGRYPAPLITNVSPERLKRHFVGDDLSYSIKKEIRDLCLFSSHSVLRDPPFSRIDLISCRNLLIYFGTDFQKIVVPVFHFALRPGGYLFLGTSENVSQYTDLFSAVEKKHRIFQRRDNVTVPLRLPLQVGGAPRSSGRERRGDSGMIAVDLRRAAEARVMEQFSPPHVVVNRDGEVIHYSARTGKFLEAPAGSPNRQLISMARRGLRGELHSALREAIEQRHRVERRGISVELDNRLQLTDLLIDPLGDNPEDPLFLIVFREVGAPIESNRDRAVRENGIQRLEDELRDTRDRLQVTVEEYETAVEELKSSNEELQSMNEELQSANEELETSKEELQSVNEELQTVNAELNSKVDEVDRANSDLRNVFESTQIATIFLDKNFVVRSFTPAVTKIFNLISSDRGRPLTDIVSNIEHNDLRRDVDTVIERGEAIERPVRRTDGDAHYLMRILPYRNRNGAVEGTLVTFVDVTELYESEQHQRNLVQELNHRVRNMLASVSAMASQTLRHSAAGNELRDIFMSRIQAMASAYNLVSRESWGEVTVKEVIETQVAAYLDGERRISIDGPEVCLKPPAALAFGMVMHELTTNSTKYGALSNDKGKVDVRWDIKDDELLVVWVEAGGPKVMKPIRKGLGSSLIESEVKLGLRGKCKLDYRPEGLVASLAIPLDPAVVSIK